MHSVFEIYTEVIFNILSNLLIPFSVPGIAERLAFKSLKEDETFHLFNKSNSDLVKLFRDNLVGGPAIIFDRHQEAGTQPNNLRYHIQ